MFREIFPDDVAVDYLLKNPKMLSPTFDADLADRQRQLTAWLQTLSAMSPSKKPSKASVTIESIIGKTFDRTVQRIEYAMTYCLDRFSRAYYIKSTEEQFEHTHPGFTQWYGP